MFLSASSPSSPPSSAQQQSQVLPRIVTLPEIEAVISDPSFATRLVRATSEGFLRADRFYAAPIQTLGSPPTSPAFLVDLRAAATNNSNKNNKKQSGEEQSYGAQTCVKTGYFPHERYYVIKVASGGYPWPSNSGLLQLYSQKTGRLECLLLDEGLLTDLRTAAVGALAVELWAPSCSCPRPDGGGGGGGGGAGLVVGILGCGIQARHQLRMIAQTAAERAAAATGSGSCCCSARVWGRDPEKVEKYMTEMERELRGLGWQVNAASSPGDLLETCDVIVTTTSSRSPLLTHPSVKDGIGEREEGERAASASASFKKLLKTRLIVCVGSDAPGKREVDEGVLACADLFVADSPAQSRERGEFQSSCPPPHLAGKILSLQEALRDPSCHRRRRPKREEGADDPAPNDEDFDEEDHRLVVFDTSGLALQDCVVATMVVEALERTSRPRRR